MKNSNTLFVLSAPSGAGKTSLVTALVAENPSLQLSVSHTTRPIRVGEVDGQSYHFVSIDEFLSLKEQGDFLEYAEVFGNYYGTSTQWVNKQLVDGDVVLEIDWQGALQVKEQLPEAVLVFILPPSLAELKSRLIGRGQDSDDVIANRLAGARTEMQACEQYDHIVINDDFDEALAELTDIMVAKTQTSRDLCPSKQKLIDELLA